LEYGWYHWNHQFFLEEINRRTVSNTAENGFLYGKVKKSLQKKSWKNITQDHQKSEEDIVKTSSFKIHRIYLFYEFV